MRKNKFLPQREQTTETNKNTIDDFLRELAASALMYSKKIWPFQLFTGLSGGAQIGLTNRVIPIFVLLVVLLSMPLNEADAQSVIPYSSYIPTAGVPDRVDNDAGLIDSEFDATGSYHFGIITSTDFITTAGAFQATKSAATTDAVLYKLDAAGQLVWSTYVGSGDVANLAASANGVIPHDKNLKLDGNDLYIGFIADAAIPGFAQIGPTGNDDMAIAKFDATTGAFQWGAVIGGTSDERLAEIEINNGEVYLAGWTAGFQNNPATDFPITAGALEVPVTTNTDLATLAIFDAATGAYEYGTTLDRGADFSRVTATSIAGNTLALGIWSQSDRNTTPDAVYPVSSNSNSALVYFDVTTRQITYDTYLSPDGNFGEGAIDIQTDGTRFYTLHENFGLIPLSPGEPADPNAASFESLYLSIFNGNIQEYVATTYGNATTHHAALKVDAANGRWFLYGGHQEEDTFNPQTGGFALVDPLQPTVAPDESSAVIREYAIGSNQQIFATHLTNNQGGTVTDVFLAPNGYLYIYGQATTVTGGLQDNDLITPDAIRSVPSAKGEMFLLKLDENRDIFYGSYLGNGGNISGFGADEIPATNRVNVRADGIVELSGWQQNPTGGTFILTDDAEFPTNNPGNFFYMQLDCCPEITTNTIDPDQTVCILGLVEVIDGPAVYVDETQYPDLLINGTTTPQTEEVNYQWQVSDNNVDWSDIPGATLRAFLPAPTSATVYYRRVAFANGQCTNGVISNVHIISVNSDFAPELTEGETNICPSTDVVIGLPATGGTSTTYSYEWSPVTNLNNPLIGQPTFNGVDGAIYTVTVTDDGNGCQAAENWAVNVISADAGEDQILCSSASNGVLIGAPGMPGGEFSYAWTVVSGDAITSLSDPNVAQPLATPTVTTIYQLETTITSAGCSTTDQVEVTVSNPVADAGPDLTFCLGDGGMLGTVALPNTTYGWAPGLYIDNQNTAQPNFLSSLCPTEDGFLATDNPIRYSVTAINDITGCTSTDFVDVYILQVDLEDTYYCPQPSVQIGAREAECGLDLPGVTFTWSVISGDGLAPGDVNLEFPTVTPTVDSEYELTVSLNGTSCTDRVQVFLPCVGSCSLDLVATSEINCPVGGQYNTQISATGDIGISTLDNLPPGYTVEWMPTTGLVSPNSLTTAVNTLAADQIYTFNVKQPDGTIICSDDITVFASVATSPLIGINEEVFTCVGESVEIGLPAVTDWSYVWTPAAGLSNPNIANPEASITEDTEYYVEATDIVTGCTYKDTVTVFLEGPIADAGPDLSFCENAIVQLGTPAQPGLTYSWEPSLGLTGANTAQPIDTIFSTVTYFLTVTDPSTGCTSTDDVTFTITTPPAYDAPDITVCEGGSVILGLPEDPSFTYFWSPATGLSDPNAAQPTATPLETTTYSVTVSDGNLGCFAVDDVVVTVVPSAFSLDLPDIKQCEGTMDVNIGVADQGGTYSWSPITGLSDPNISNPTVTITGTPITYTLNWTTPDGCTLQDDQMVMAFEEAALSFPTSFSICEGESVIIGPATAEVGATYLWTSLSGDGTGTLSSTTIHNPEATPTQNTTYQLSYTSPNGCPSTRDVTVVVNPIPSFDLGPDQPVCGDVPVVLTPTFLVGDVGGTDYFESFEADAGGWVQSTNGVDDDFDWTRDENGTPTTNTGPSTGANGSDWYFYTEDNGGTGATAIITSPVITLAAATSDMSFYYHRYSRFSRMGSTTLEISSDGGTSWTQIWTRTTVNDGNTWNRVILDVSAYSGMTINIRFIGVRGAGGGTWSDMAFDEISFPANTQPIITNYSWSSGESTESISVAPLTPTTYSLTVTGANGCTATNEILITPNFTISAGQDQDICPTSSVTIGSATTTPGLIYSWSIVSGPGPLPAPANTAQIEVTPTATTTYQLTVDDGAGCVRTDEVTVNVDPPTVVDLGPNQIVCIDGCVTIGIPAAAGFSYQWVPATGISDPTQSMVTVCPTADIDYELFVTKLSTGCTFSDEIQLTIGTDNAPAADAGMDVTICSGETAQLGVAAMPGLTYTWSPTTGLSDPSIANPTVTLTNTTSGQTTTTYILSVLEPLTNCFALDTVLVMVDPQPVVSISPVPSVCAGSTYTMSASATGSDLTYSWLPAAAFDDPTILNPTFIGTATTTVTLVVTTGTSCQGTATATITINPEVVVADAGPDQTVCINDAVTIGGAGTTAGLDYFWSRTAPFPSTSRFLYTDRVQTNATATPLTNGTFRSGTFQLTVTGASGCEATDEMILLVQPEATINAGDDAFVCGGDSYMLGATPTGSGTGTWSQVSGPTTANFDDVNSETATVSNLTTGSYRFRWDVTGAICNAGRDFVTIEVVDPPVLVVNAITGLCGADRADLTAAAVTAGSTLNGASLSYWLDAAATVPVPDATMVQAGTYYIRAFNGSTSCEVTEAISIQIPQCVAVGNLVFMDNNNNGTFEMGTDMGVSMVSVQLYSAGATPGVDAPVATVMTDANGYYYFDNVAPGDYFVHLPATNFTAGQALENKFSYPGADGTDNTDNNDNGIDAATPAVDGVSSNTFTLTPNGMPTGEDQTNYMGTLDDNNVNATIDFSFRNLLDFGDLPDVYSTLLANDGPGHVIVPDLQIGATIDNETDGQPLAGADGDDTNGDDEDGVDFTNVAFSAGNSINVPVVVTNNTGSDATLYAFIDWNNDGDFGDLGEIVEVVVSSAAGAQTILVPFTIPEESDGTAINITTGARFRLTTDDLATTNPGLELWEGLATDGEIEDYILMISCPTGNCFGVEITTTNN